MTKDEAAKLSNGTEYNVHLQGGGIVMGKLQGTVQARAYTNGQPSWVDVLALSGAHGDGLRFDVTVDLADVESVHAADKGDCPACLMVKPAQTAKPIAKAAKGA